MQWISSEVCPKKSQVLEEALGVPSFLASLLVRAEKECPKEAAAFLNPRLADLEDPFEIAYLQEGAARIVKAIHNKEAVCVMGDYDVDGVTSTTALVSFLKEFGLDPRYFIPRRSDEGYGLNMVALDRLLDEGALDLLIVVDSGTNAVEPVAALQAKGVEVIIVDHHRSKSDLPACTLINPHVHDADDKPWKYLCSAGLVFKLIHGIIKLMRQEGHTHAQHVSPKNYLDLVAMGTIADLMPLDYENRIFAKHGLIKLKQSDRSGIHALFEVSGISRDQTLQPQDIAFKMGPRINASGRLADAALAVEMLLGNKFSECLKAAKELDQMNRERQDIEEQITQEARALIESNFLDSKGLILYSEAWHTGVVGIVSGKLSREYNRPCIVLGREGDLLKGSGRSLYGMSLVEALGLCDDYLENWGGHPLAVGVSLKEENLELLRGALNQALDQIAPGELPESTLEIAYWLDPHMINEKFMEELDSLRPFGEGNPEPVWGVRRAKLASPVDVFGGKHFRFAVQTNSRWPLKGIAWNKADNLPPHDAWLDLAVKLQWNYWNGNRYLQLLLIDWRLA